MSVTVYKPQCVQCGATIKALDKAGLAYELVDLTIDTDARDYIMALGHLQAPVMALGHFQAPVIVTETDHWAGFRPDRIKNLTHNAA